MQDKTDSRHHRLREFITGRSWTKAEFARRVGIYPQDVNKYLAGQLNIENLYLRLQEAGCDVQWLRTGEKRSDSEEEAMLAMLKQRGITDTLKLERLLAIADNAQQFAARLNSVREGLTVIGHVDDYGGMTRVPMFDESSALETTTPTKAVKAKKSGGKKSRTTARKT